MKVKRIKLWSGKNLVALAEGNPLDDSTAWQDPYGGSFSPGAQAILTSVAVKPRDQDPCVDIDGRFFERLDLTVEF